MFKFAVLELKVPESVSTSMYEPTSKSLFRLPLYALFGVVELLMILFPMSTISPFTLTLPDDNLGAKGTSSCAKTAAVINNSETRM